MSGSRLARGRVGRLALLSCGVLSVVFLVLLYRSTSAEMARLKDLHVKCAQQQEALAAQLQVIYEYKVQLEKTLSNEKSANAAAKEELQQKASRERSLRDKDTAEAMHRYNALQQNYKQLQTEQQDLKDDCKKKEDVALENVKRLETTAQELRIELKKAAEDKEKSMEHLKNKYMETIHEKEQLEEKYNALKKATGNSSGNLERLQKEVIQLHRELEDAKKALHFSVGSVKMDDTQVLARHIVNTDKDNNNNNVNVDTAEKSPGQEGNQMQMARPSSQQQTSAASKPEPIAGAKVIPPESKSSSPRPNINRLGIVKLPEGVPPIPRIIEQKNEDDNNDIAKRQQEAPEQMPAVLPDAERQQQRPKVDESHNDDDVQQSNMRQAPVGEQILDRHEADNWYKLKPGVQEVGDPHHIDKNGFDNAGGNEDVEQYDDYNYKEPQNKNGDLHLEEGEDEREDEDDYVHNNMNGVKHE